MKVQIDKTFPMPASADVSWRFLQDIAAVAACMPGATITERLDDTHYKGAVSVKVGPATMSFRGDIEVRELDAATRTLRLIGKGADTTGTSGASLDLTARVEAAAGGLSNLVGKSEATVSGKAAAFGGRMMTSVADQVLKQFAANFATQVELLKAPQAGAGPLAASPPPRELNGLALFWAILKDWIRGFFSKQQE
jgi:carbon monoxide dehydrogenase subunit G